MQPYTNIPTVEDFQRGRVTNPNQSEVVRQTLYDSLLLPAAGAQQLTFFQTAVGQGLTSAVGATAGTPKTLFDTNMMLGGQLPSGMGMMAESIEITFYPGSVSTTNTYTIDAITFFAAVAAVTVTAQVDDVNAFYQSGMLELNVLAKNYLREQPLCRFPPKCSIDVVGAVASNSATTSEVGFAAAHAQGRPYYLEPVVTLLAAQNFEVALKWPGLVAMPSTFNARVGVIIDGYTLRASQ